MEVLEHDHVQQQLFRSPSSARLLSPHKKESSLPSRLVFILPSANQADFFTGFFLSLGTDPLYELKDSVPSLFSCDEERRGSTQLLNWKTDAERSPLSSTSGDADGDQSGRASG